MNAEYEFSMQENDTIRTVGGRARAWGLISVVIGALAILGGLGLMVAIGGSGGPVVGGALILLAVQYVVSGGRYIAAGSAMRAVVETEGDDMTHMMEAIKKLTGAVRLEAIVAIVASVLGLALGVATYGSKG